MAMLRGERGEAQRESRDGEGVNAFEEEEEAAKSGSSRCCDGGLTGREGERTVVGEVLSRTGLGW